MRLRLVDAQGRLAAERSVAVVAGEQRLAVPTATIAKGVYLLEVTAAGQRGVQRLIRQ